MSLVRKAFKAACDGAETPGFLRDVVQKYLREFDERSSAEA
jgi:hypothetical protein